MVQDCGVCISERLELRSNTTWFLVLVSTKYQYSAYQSRSLCHILFFFVLANSSSDFRNLKYNVNILYHFKAIVRARSIISQGWRHFIARKQLLGLFCRFVVRCTCMWKDEVYHNQCFICVYILTLRGSCMSVLCLAQ